jgi:hypothetical protein
VRLAHGRTLRILALRKRGHRWGSHETRRAAADDPAKIVTKLLAKEEAELREIERRERP